MIMEHWELTTIRGWNPENEQKYLTEEILHRRGTDPFVLACKRNRELAGCSHFNVFTEEVFTEFIREENGRRRKADIPRGRKNDEEWDW